MRNGHDNLESRPSGSSAAGVARPGIQVADLMRGGRVVATITRTDLGLRIVSHDGRTWSKPRWSAKRSIAIDVQFEPQPEGDNS